MRSPPRQEMTSKGNREPMLDSTWNSLPLHPLIQQQRRVPAKVVAELFGLSAEYFVKCINARSNPEYARKQGISASTLKALPLQGWSKLGKRHMILEADLLAQIEGRL